MNTLEHRELVFCSTNESVIIPQGKSGKTKDILVGCMVPIVIYQNEVVLGHFGPLYSRQAYLKLKEDSLPDRAPDKVILYSIDPHSSFWLPRKNDYDVWRKTMHEVVADVTGLETNQIKERFYPMVSEVVIDWTIKEQEPIIFAQPAPIHAP